jgi:hypothetical protein
MRTVGVFMKSLYVRDIYMYAGHSHVFVCDDVSESPQFHQRTVWVHCRLIAGQEYPLRDVKLDDRCLLQVLPHLRLKQLYDRQSVLKRLPQIGKDDKTHAVI